jgi:hypothetical protein
MKYLAIILITGLFIFSNCKKQESQEMYLSISSTEWYTDTFMINNITFQGIYLNISGISNAQLLSLETTGDGTAGCMEMEINQSNEFSSNVLIRFWPTYSTDPKKAHTVVTAFSSREKPDIVFCDATGSGETLRKELESPYFP